MEHVLTHAERGRMGGLKTLEKHGPEWFSKLGQKGGLRYLPLEIKTQEERLSGEGFRAQKLRFQRLQAKHLETGK